jgi:ATP-binding cassette subfamily B protein
MRGLGRLFSYYQRHKREFWLGMALLLAARLFEAVIPQLLRAGIDGLASGSAPLAELALGILACVGARYGVVFVGRRAIRKLGVEVSFDLRNRLYDHLQKQGPGFYARYRTGDLMARAINDIGLIRRVVALGTRTAVVLLFSSLVAFGCMLWQSPSLTALLLPPMPLVFGSAYLLSKRLHAQSLAVQEGFSGLSDRVQENLAGIRTIRALGQEDAEIARFERENDSYTEQNRRLLVTNSLLASLMPAFGALSVVAVLLFGGARVAAGELTLGTFAAFLWYLNMVLWPVREAGAMINLFERGAAGCDRLFELLDTRPEIREIARPRTPTSVRGAISFHDVSVRREGSAAPALDGIDLEIAAGESLAVLGRIGSGKSTLLQLLVRLLDPSSGRIEIDGIAVQDWPLAELRRAVAFVPQEPFLFSESVRENLSYDDPTRPLERVRAAAEAADFAEAVARFPNGYDTEVGERGVLLSGGQRQRLTLARALIREAPVLLLDDPFASVDGETEERILAKLTRLRAGRTTIWVTHRLSAARAAQRVVVLDHGRIAEHGTPGELRARGGLFAELERTQSRAERLARELEGAAPALGGAPS